MSTPAQVHNGSEFTSKVIGVSCRGGWCTTPAYSGWCIQDEYWACSSAGYLPRCPDLPPPPPVERHYSGCPISAVLDERSGHRICIADRAQDIYSLDTASALYWRIMRPHIQHSHRAYSSGKPRYGNRYYLTVAGALVGIGMLYLASSHWLIR